MITPTLNTSNSIFNALKYDATGKAHEWIRSYLTVDAKSIFSAKCVFSDTFNVNSKYLELSQEVSFLRILIQPIQNVKRRKNNFFLLSIINEF
jgi:hypothetical protein